MNLKLFALTLRQELLSLVHPDNHMAMATAFDGAVANVLLDHASGQTSATPVHGQLAESAPKRSSGKKSKGKLKAGSPEAAARGAQAAATRAANKAKKEAEAKANGSAVTGPQRTGFGGAPIGQPGASAAGDVK